MPVWIRGSSSSLRITSPTRSSLRPREPAGWKRAKSSREKPRSAWITMAKASPRASMAEVLAVGARPRGQASFMAPMFSTQSACLARLELAPPVMAMIFAPMRRMGGIRERISAVSPELERARTMSSGRMRPRSPCTASAGCRVRLGVPVEARVAEILAPTSPALPMPVTTTRPWSDPKTMDTAASKAAKSVPRLAAKRLIAAASWFKTSTARPMRDFVPSLLVVKLLLLQFSASRRAARAEFRPRL